MANEAIETVAPDGDVVLVVAPPRKHHLRKIRVSASTLSAVSPVFKALFGPHFSEGQQPRDATDPVEIQLPDDNYGAIDHLCRMAHLVYINLSIGVSEAFLLELAVAVDKYCCAASLELQCSALLFKWIIDDMGQVTSEDVLWRALAEERSAARRRFCNVLADLGASNYWHNGGCATQARDFTHMLALSFGLPFWPPNFDTPDNSIQVLLDKTRGLQGWKHSDYSSCGRIQYDQGVSSQRFREAADRVAAACAGLCLACAKASSINMGSKCLAHRAKQAIPVR
ncbi:hypothetical protein CBER1_09234 [Cercospora berteroae]|uniref:BTB domain-containing protein n=1 Tax=Cercospora berteroae TaxID=357750 RepID=A0A2S6BVH7_9PEZI|nr:hypothetical protein CBER1_09234 [Cercospora berteroae]